MPEYKELVNYWMENRYTLRYTGGLVPDVCQQFTKKMGVFSNPTSKSSPAKIRLAFEAPPFGYLTLTQTLTLTRTRTLTLTLTLNLTLTLTLTFKTIEGSRIVVDGFTS